jgi:hypothetical protein
MENKYGKPPFCIHKEKSDCKGCEYNMVPELNDGGCKLYSLKQKQEADHDKH